VPVDLSAFYTRRPEVVKAAFSLVPDYLRTMEESVAPNMMDYGVSLGRRFRALKLWMVIRAFGVDGIAARIREHVRLAQLFREWAQVWCVHYWRVSLMQKSQREVTNVGFSSC